MNQHEPYKCDTCPIAIEKKKYYMENSNSVQDAVDEFRLFLSDCSSNCCQYSRNKMEHDSIALKIKELKNLLKNLQ